MAGRARIVDTSYFSVAARRVKRKVPSGNNGGTTSRARRHRPMRRPKYGETSSRTKKNQRRAAIWRTQQETTRVTKLLDEWGNERYVRQHGKMNITKHTKVLSVLEMRAQRYRRKGQQLVDVDQRLLNQAIDETGTVDTAPLSDSDDESTTNQLAEHEFLKEKGIAEELLNVHGVAPSRKPDGVSRLIYENGNGFSTTISGNEKLDKAKEIIDDLEAGIMGYSETKVNSRHKQNVNGLL